MPEKEPSQIAIARVVAVKDADAGARHKRLPGFIRQNIQPIVGEWETFARTLTPSADGINSLALRDHVHEILDFIVTDITVSQSAEAQESKSHGKEDEKDSAAQTHAALRFAGGFDIGQMASEYRALRASVLRLWSRTSPPFDAQDITDITRFNESVDQQLAESVNFYTRKVAQSKDLVVGMLGHDLRSPLQAIMLSAELTLHMGTLNDRQTMLIKKVVESSNRMSALINDLLDVTRARFGGGLPVVRTMMNMGFVAQQIVDEIRTVHSKRTVDLTMSGSLMGEWDKARIGQVFSNLIGNAMQYSFPGSPVRVDLAGDSTALTLVVANDGAPIPPAKIERIFDPLTRGLANEHSLPSSGNLGLGLFITKEVVVAHNGTIEVTSSEATGTIFTVRFPRSKPASSVQDKKQKQA